ncbi:MAG: NAD(P)/FAD-dependent oxidoreductase, partial [Bacteroidia bacterium]
MILDYIIVGQGIAGSLLGYELLNSGRKIIVIDEDKPTSPSKIAAGIIQPITGRRIVKTWRADSLIPFARNYYHEIENRFGEKLFFDLPILEIFDSVKTRNDWVAKGSEPGYEKYLGGEIYPEFMKHVFKSPHGGILINKSGYMDIAKLAGLLKKHFLEKGVLHSETFSFDEMKIKTEGIKWKNITASKIIFCQGYSFFPIPFFSHLPLLPAKGENSII